MSDEIKKICKNCDNLQYGFGESSISYGPRCFEKDCGVDEGDTCDMFEVASYLKVKKLQEENKTMREALELISATDTSSFAPDLLWLTKWRNNTKERAREALAKVEK